VRPHHRVTRILSTALITAGLVVLADAGVTLLWEEPVSAAYGNLQQGRASDELSDLESTFATEVAGADTDAARARILAERFSNEIGRGDPIGRIKVSSVGIDFVLLNGTDTATLQKGPGRYPQTPLPGLGGTTGIAGHRTTYAAPFRKVNEIEDGDEIEVELPYGIFTYTVQKHEIVDPSDVEIVEPVGYDRVVLTACHPLYSAAQRYAVFGRLTEVQTFAVSGDGEWPIL
jgi:sortase A